MVYVFPYQKSQFGQTFEGKEMKNVWDILWSFGMFILRPIGIL
jgi:hypothetical protein